MKATSSGGALLPIENCYVTIGGKKITLYVLPDISDSKSASYNDEPILGRAFPLKTYAYSENRSISMTIHLLVVREEDISWNIRTLRLIESAVYPREGSQGVSFLPPFVCQIKCGKLLAEDELCVVLRSYSVKFPTDVVWDDGQTDAGVYYTPYKFDIDTTWEVVYRSRDLPGAEKIMDTGGSLGMGGSAGGNPANGSDNMPSGPQWSP